MSFSTLPGGGGRLVTSAAADQNKCVASRPSEGCDRVQPYCAGLDDTVHW